MSITVDNLINKEKDKLFLKLTEKKMRGNIQNITFIYIMQIHSESRGSIFPLSKSSHIYN